MHNDHTPPDETTPKRAWHASPYWGIEHVGFKLDKIGTGTGLRSPAFGIYFTDNRDSGERYRKQIYDLAKIDRINKLLSELSREMDKYRAGECGKFKDPRGYELKAKYDRLINEKTTPGQLYSMEMPDDDELLDWDRSINGQSKKIIEKLQRYNLEFKTERGTPESKHPDLKTYGSSIYGYLTDLTGSEKAATLYLSSIGIPGLRYLNHFSNAYEYVIWDEKRLNKNIQAHYSPNNTMNTLSEEDMQPPIGSTSN